MNELALTWSAPRATCEAIARCVRVGLESLRALPPMRHSDWAAKHFRMAGASSHQRGGWEAWPFQIGLMDWMCDDDIYELDVMKSKRVGYTKILTSSIGFDAAWRRRNQAIWQPTDDDRDSFVKTEVDPMIDSVPAVRQARRLTKGVEDTLKYKQFRDTVVHLLGGKAARAYRRITVAVAKLDELDGFDRQVEKSADPFTLAEGRLEGAPFPKIICGSTPRIRGISHIEHRAEQADVFMRYHIECPKCRAEHPLWFGGADQAWGFKWTKGQPDTVRHVCPHCRAGIAQADYLSAWVGAWVCIKTGVRYGADGLWRSPEGQLMKAPRHVAAQVWTAYSPQRDWPDIVRQFLAARVKQKAGDNGPLQGFVNETLGETWQETGDGGDENVLQSRAKASGFRLGQVPVGCLVLIAGVDVQDNRFEITVWGFGRGEEMWTIDDQVLEANPADERDWLKLDAYLQSRYRQHWHGGSLSIEAVVVDTGGHFTHQVYNFVRAREHRRFYAVRGSSKYGGQIKGSASRVDVNWRGQVIKQGVKLWEVGTDTAKDLIYGRMKVVQPGPGCMHFAEDLPREWFEQLTAEVRVPQKTSVGEVYRWVKRRARNEKLDCCAYAIFGAHVLDLHRYTERMWDKLEAAVQPPPDLFAAAAPSPYVPATALADDSEVHTHAQAQTSPAERATTPFARAW